LRSQIISLDKTRHKVAEISNSGVNRLKHTSTHIHRLF